MGHGVYISTLVGERDVDAGVIASHRYLSLRVGSPLAPRDARQETGLPIVVWVLSIFATDTIYYISLAVHELLSIIQTVLGSLLTRSRAHPIEQGRVHKHINREEGINIEVKMVPYREHG